jgi:hypothetical protein
MNGIVKVGTYDDSDLLPKDPIEVIMNDSEFYLDVPNQIVRATVEMQDFSPSDGQYFMKVTHLQTGKIVKTSEIYPKAAGNDLYSVKIAHPLSESDIMVGGQALLGEYEVLVYSENGVNTGSAKFTILETMPQQKAEPVKESKIKIIDAELNQNTFDDGQTIVVTGSVNDVLHGNTVSARVLSPTGDIISIEKTYLNEDGGFTYTLAADNLLFEKNGDYTISLLYGIQDIRKDVYFSYVGNAPPKPEPIPDPKPIPDPEPTPKVEQAPKVEQVTPKVEEKIVTPEIKQTPTQGSDESEDYTIILIIAVIIIIAVIVAVIAAKKRNQSRGDPMSDDYDVGDYGLEEEPKKKMEW